MCNSADNSGFYVCIKNVWTLEKCSKGNMCRIVDNAAICVPPNTPTKEPEQSCSKPNESKCDASNPANFFVCTKNKWEKMECDGDNVCMARDGKTSCVDKATADAPVQPCTQDKATRCVDDNKDIFQVCQNKYWTNSTCSSGNVCGTKQGSAICHDPKQPIIDVPDQPCAEKSPNRCVPGNNTLYQICYNKLWSNNTCPNDDVCIIINKAAACVDKNVALSISPTNTLRQPEVFVADDSHAASRHEKAQALAKAKPSKKRHPVPAKSYRRSVRLAAKAHLVSEAAPPALPPAAPPPPPRKRIESTTAAIAKEFYDRLEDISKQLSLLTVGQLSSLSLLVPILINPKKSSETGSDIVASFDSERTVHGEPPLYPISNSLERDICRTIFAPTATVPKPKELKVRLHDSLVTRIPIHHYVYNLLKPVVDANVLVANFSIAEEVGNICPTLTPCVERALMITNVNVGTESMQQHVLDAFLMGIIGTAQDHLASNIKIDRNSAESSMTLPQCRPDYLLTMNGQLVFKGEEKKGGDIRRIAEELTDKMIPGSVGKTGRLDYLLGYATSGSQVLFECIYDNHTMLECSDIIDLAKLPDRVTMVIMLVNVVRIVGAQMLSKRE
ncbi:hypothetical protein GGI20_000890 [Coemansia sp. BCRC 34301]|nr:hypothetical protein GGI20_000890 [Coemansia sp. BCRC 34301]